MRTVQGNQDIWLLDDSTRTSRFTFDASLDRFAIWSRDGRSLVFDSNRKGYRDLYQKSSSGAGEEELLVEFPEDKTVTDWSSDSRFVLYSTAGSQTALRDVWVLPMAGAMRSRRPEPADGRKPWAFLKTSFDERSDQISEQAGGHSSNESGLAEIYIRPFSRLRQVKRLASPVGSGSVGGRRDLPLAVRRQGYAVG